MIHRILFGAAVALALTVPAGAEEESKTPQETNQPCASSSQYTLKSFLPCPAVLATPAGETVTTQQPALGHQERHDNPAPPRRGNEVPTTRE